MKQFYLTLFVSLALVFTGLNAQVFVDHSASGDNDGTSWEHAFTDLGMALSTSSPGDEIWVAAGTYKPGGAAPSVDTFFWFPHDLQLYGGFAGTEGMLSERDWTVNETILSGDHNDDDVANDYTVNRTDNSKHVMWLTDTVTNVSVIDGFTISNGQTEPATGAGDDRRGGGILTYGNPSIRNCTFTQNFGHFGGGLYPRGTDPIVIEDCTFTNNNASWGGGGIYINSDAATVSNCVFANNAAVTRRGGGLASFDCVITVTDCTFENNSAGDSSGGGMHIANDDEQPAIEIFVTDCTFTGNDATFGGGLACYGATLTANISGCDFSENSAVNVGGGMTNAFGVTSNITDCNFSENESFSTGGAIFSQNDGNVITLTNVNIVSNAALRGGGITITGDDEPLLGTPLPILNLEKVFFIANIATEQGGGINFGNVNAHVSNTLFDTNLATNADGIGGAVSLNTNDTLNATYSFINSTFVNNSAFIGTSIASWKEGVDGTSELRLQNTILNNGFGGNNYEIEAGDPTVVSLGGNLSTDGTLMPYFTGMNDLNSEDPLFVDIDDLDYHLQAGSPCIDAGISAGAPLTDIEGLPRVGEVDMGAFENQGPVDVQHMNKLFGQLTIFPNPVQDDLNFTFTSVWRGELDIQLTTADGRVISTKTIDKNDKDLQQTFDVRQLPEGMYNISISNGLLINTQQFVK